MKTIIHTNSKSKRPVSLMLHRAQVQFTDDGDKIVVANLTSSEVLAKVPQLNGLTLEEI